MSISERKAREQAQVRQQVVDAACRLAERSGWYAVSARLIAAEIHYSTKKIYTLFDNMEAVLFEVIRHGYRVLGERMQQEQQSTVAASPQQQLLAVSRAYRDFAHQHTVLYEAMFTLKGVVILTKTVPPEASLAGRIVKKIGLELGVPAADINLYFNNWWGLAHGIVSLSLLNYMHMDPVFFEAVFTAAMQRFVTSF